MIWSGECFDMVGYPKRWLVVASKMVRDDIKFWQENFLKNIK